MHCNLNSLADFFVEIESSGTLFIVAVVSASAHAISRIPISGLIVGFAFATVVDIWTFATARIRHVLLIDRAMLINLKWRLELHVILKMVIFKIFLPIPWLYTDIYKPCVSRLVPTLYRRISFCYHRCIEFWAPGNGRFQFEWARKRGDPSCNIHRIVLSACKSDKREQTNPCWASKELL